MLLIITWVQRVPLGHLPAEREMISMKTWWVLDMRIVSLCKHSRCGKKTHRSPLKNPCSEFIPLLLAFVQSEIKKQLYQWPSDIIGRTPYHQLDLVVLKCHWGANKFYLTTVPVNKNFLNSHFIFYTLHLEQEHSDLRRCPGRNHLTFKKHLLRTCYVPKNYSKALAPMPSGCLHVILSNMFKMEGSTDRKYPDGNKFGEGTETTLCTQLKTLMSPRGESSTLLPTHTKFPGRREVKN